MRRAESEAKLMIGHVLSSRLSSFSTPFKSGSADKQSFTPKLNEESKDTFEKNKQNNPTNFLVAFTGKIDQNAAKIAKTFFTKGDNLFLKALNGLQVGIKGGQDDLIATSIKSINSAMTNFEKSLKWFKPVIPEAEFAEKANYVGAKYIDLGNVTQNPLCYQRAYELFDEASDIAQTHLYEEQQKAMTMVRNKEELDKFLHPQPIKNPIGFLMGEQSAEMKKTDTLLHKKEQIGFIKSNGKVL